MAQGNLLPGAISWALFGNARPIVSVAGQFGNNPREGQV